ncbi:hypothetical protein MP477_07335 [Chryseobacterium sp. WG23]|nr:hypothetical protein [Chryseobacterium sp. WG23]MCQ9634767.1 hypothetical protein [Chryseobacterium sp. WG23]
MDKNEKERRKQILNELRQKQQEEFEVTDYLVVINTDENGLLDEIAMES